MSTVVNPAQKTSHPTIPGLSQDHALASAGGCNIFTNFVPQKVASVGCVGQRAVNVGKCDIFVCMKKTKMVKFCWFVCFSQVNLADFATLANICWDTFCHKQ